MRDGEAVGGLEVVHVVVEVEGLLRGVLVGVVQLHGEAERAVLLDRGAQEQSACTGEDSASLGLQLVVGWRGGRYMSSRNLALALALVIPAFIRSS